MKNKKNIAYFIYAVLTAAILVLARKHFVELKGSSLDLANTGYYTYAVRDQILSGDLLFFDWVSVMLPRLDLAGIEPLLMTRHLSRKQFTLLRLKWSWPYLACLFVIHLIYWPGSWLAAVSLILLFAAAAGMTLYQRRYLGGIKDSIWVFAVFALLRLLATLLFKI